jgi:hypothetical protein
MDKQDKLLHIHPNSAEICEMKLPNEALELKAIENGKEGVVFIRSKQVLELADPMQVSIVTLTLVILILTFNTGNNTYSF